MGEIRLFDYQEDMLSRVTGALACHRSVMAQMPTGTGKTYLLAAIVRHMGCGSVLIVAHRRELVAQIEDTLARFRAVLGHDALPAIRVVSVQWLSRHVGDVADNAPALVVVDEAHHAVAATYRVLWKLFPQARFLGLTATPCRLNGSGFADLFDVLVCSWDIPRFIAEGRLAAYDFVSLRPSSKTQRLISSLRKRGADGDYQVKEMDCVLNTRPSIERLYDSFCQYGSHRKGIVYAINISHARAIAQYYSERGVSAVAIDSSTPPGERKALVARFCGSCGTGDIQVIVNVDVFSEGFDCPDIEFVQLARPTLSLAKYLQMVGRGLRVAPGKRCCVIIDNVGLYRVFGLPSRVWNWDAMFRGMGKRRRGGTAVVDYAQPVAVERPEHIADTELTVVVTHRQLARTMERQAADARLEAKRERVLRGGMGQVTSVGRNLVRVTGRGNGRVAYVDLLNMAYIEGKNIGTPRVVKVGGVEMLRYGNRLHSRTRTPLAIDCYAATVSNRGYYSLCLPGTGTCMCRVAKGDVSYLGGYAAVFLHDSPADYFWLSGEMADGSIIVMDMDGSYFRVGSDGSRVYV